MVLDPDFKSITQILPNIYHLPEFPYYDCSVYLIKENADNFHLIDTGNGRSFNALEMGLDMEGFDLHNIKSIIITHAHFDHIFGLYRIFETVDNDSVKIYVHSQAFEILQQGKGDQFQLKDLGLTLKDFKITPFPLSIILTFFSIQVRRSARDRLFLR